MSAPADNTTIDAFAHIVPPASAMDIPDADKARIYSGNIERLLGV